MRTALLMLLLAGLAAPLATVAPARAATDDSTQTNPPPQSGHECERRRETPTS